MKLYGIGNALLYYREQKRLSQLQVCEGICTEMTISRMETGEREFESIISYTLFSRIGKTANRFEFVLDNEDYHLYSLREKIEQELEAHMLEAVELYLAEYKKKMPCGHVLHDQFVLYSQAMIMKLSNGNKEEIIELLQNAINMTRADYCKNDGKLRLFSTIEIKIVYQLFMMKQYAEDVIYPVLQFVETIYDEEEKEKILIPFYSELLRKYNVERKFSQALEVADKAIDILLFGRNYFYLLDFYLAKVQAEVNIYIDSIQWEQKREELRVLCNELYYMYMVDEKVECMEKVERFCKEKLECQITK